MFFGVSRSVTECFQSVTDYLQPVTELGTPKNMAVALPGMTLQPFYMEVSSETSDQYMYMNKAYTNIDNLKIRSVFRTRKLRIIILPVLQKQQLAPLKRLQQSSRNNKCIRLQRKQGRR